MRYSKVNRENYCVAFPSWNDNLKFRFDACSKFLMEGKDHEIIADQRRAGPQPMFSPPVMRRSELAASEERSMKPDEHAYFSFPPAGRWGRLRTWFERAILRRELKRYVFFVPDTNDPKEYADRYIEENNFPW